MSARRGAPKRSRLAAAVAALVALGAGVIGSGGSALAGSAPNRPNIVVIQTDDQTAASLRFMANTQRLLGERGATFTRHYANWPVCCPSRATLLTGQYSHNHGVLGNSPPAGGFQAFDNDHTTAVWLNSRGYTTAHVGKFLNGYGNAVADGPDPIPPGWDEWYTADGEVQTVYDYTLNENGTFREYGQAVAHFKQDVFTARAQQLISEHVGAGRPLYLQLDYTAPHSGGPNPNPHPPTNCQQSAKPAPRHASAFNTAAVPELPNFNEADVSDKPQAIQNMPLMDGAAIDNLTRRYRCRLESLLSVDEGVADVVAAIRAENAIDDTYFIFTSDNGFFTGEHRVQNGKTRVYEPSSRIPLILRGPDVPEGVSVRDLTINADLAATVVNVTGAQPTVAIDGRSLLPAAKRAWVERGRELLIDTAQYEAIHTQRYVWVEYETGEFELYDLKRDPYQLQSRHSDPAYAGIRQRLTARLAALRSCAGAACKRAPALRRKLKFRKGPKRCAETPVKLRVKGADIGEVDRIEVFRKSKRIDGDSRRPFRERLSKRELGGRGKVVLRVRAELLDGRRIGWEKKLKVCG